MAQPAHPELQRLLQLLQTERQADLEEYQTKIVNTPLAERRRRGTSWYPVVVTESGFGPGERLYLDVEKTTDLRTAHLFGTGKSVSLFSAAGDPKNPDAIGGIVSFLGLNRMRIVFNADEIPDWLDDGKLGVNLLFDETTYSEMTKAVREVMGAAGNRAAQLRDVLLGHQPAAFDRKAFTPTLPRLNESQGRAVANALQARDVAIIHGPPGTGKTTTLVETILLTLQTEKQVLVCSPSNASVDLLTDLLAARGVDVVRIGHPARVGEDTLQHTVDVRLQNDKAFPQIKKLRKQADEYSRLAHQYKRNFGRAEREQRKQVLAEARKLSQEANQTEKYLIDKLLSGARVITCTLVGAANRHLEGRTYRTVFLDEAAQALEPATWIPILRAERVVFAGDHCQLPPTIKSAQAARDGLGLTLFEKAVARQPEAPVMLQTQYRMHEKIMHFSNRQFYHNGLRAADSVREAVLGEADPLREPFTFLDTAGCGFEEQTSAENQSLSNPEEGRLLLRYLELLLEALQAESPETLAGPFRVGIISPYRAQVEFLEDAIGDFSLLNTYRKSIAVHTVDGFQGQEREVIGISLVRSNDDGEIGFLQDVRRMNVALTRARKKLVVAGDSATLAGHPFYKAFLDYVEEAAAYHSAWEFMG
jgi:superfamily I DNA and/or RNA helicase